MSRHFLIALLSVLLPGGILPVGVISHDGTPLPPPRAFVVALRAMPGMSRASARGERRLVAARPVRGVYLVSARRPAALMVPRAEIRMPDRYLWRPLGLRAPPSFA